MRRFDYSFLKEQHVPPDLMSRVARISRYSIRAEARKKEFPEVFAGLESISRLQSVKGSNAIEGILTTDRRIKEIVSKKSAPMNHDEEEIAGYRDALDIIHNNHDSMRIDETTILDLHRIMLSHSSEEGGTYKKEDNVIMGTDASGRRFIHYEPVPAAETEDSMEQILLAYADAHQDSMIDDLLLIPCFILDFLCIHPFLDGNGRISRLLSLLLMYRDDIDVGKYISFEEMINKNKSAYYGALTESSKGWHTNESDYLPFIEHFMGTLFLCYRELDRRFTIVGNKKFTKKNRIEAIVMNSIIPISKKDILTLLPDVSETTVEAEISRLKSEGRIEMVGQKKGARYLRTRTE